MAPDEIFSRIDAGRTLFGASGDDLRLALSLAKREIHKHEINKALKYNAAFNSWPKTVTDDKFYKRGRKPSLKRRRCPTKRELG